MESGYAGSVQSCFNYVIVNTIHHERIKMKQTQRPNPLRLFFSFDATETSSGLFLHTDIGLQ